MSEHTNLRRERSRHLEQHMQRPWGGAAHLSQGEARAGWLEQKGSGQGLGGVGGSGALPAAKAIPVGTSGCLGFEGKCPPGRRTLMRTGGIKRTRRTCEAPALLALPPAGLVD